VTLQPINFDPLGKLIKLPRKDEFRPPYTKFEDENKITVIMEIAGDTTI